jgi:hypothetical protein
MRWLYLLLIICLIISCSGPVAKFTAPDYTKPNRIAILPTINQTVDVKGAEVFRNIFYYELLDKEYTELVDILIVDSLLNDQGITDGGQLETIDNQELFKELNVDGLIYIELLICSIAAMDYNAVGRVKANIKLYVPPEKLIWEDEREEKTTPSRVSSTGDLLSDTIGQLLVEFVGKTIVRGAGMALFEHECKMEMIKLVQNSIKTLP